MAPKRNSLQRQQQRRRLHQRRSAQLLESTTSVVLVVACAARTEGGGGIAAPLPSQEGRHHLAAVEAVAETRPQRNSDQGAHTSSGWRRAAAVATTIKVVLSKS